MNINLNNEWSFVQKEIVSSNKGGSLKGEMLFEFQILLPALYQLKKYKERQMLSRIYQERKMQYLNI